MKTIRLKNLDAPILIGDAHYGNDAVVHVPDGHAEQYVKLGIGEPADGQPAHNADRVNHLGDAISPMPPEGHVATALDNTPQYKKDGAPGLKELDQAFRAGPPPKATDPVAATTPKRSGRVAPEAAASKTP